MKQLLTDMKNAAEKATKGEWKWDSDVEDEKDSIISSTGERIITTDLRQYPPRDNDAAHIFASSPHNVLKLLEYVEELERDNSELKLQARHTYDWLTEFAPETYEMIVISFRDELRRRRGAPR